MVRPFRPFIVAAILVVLAAIGLSSASAAVAPSATPPADYLTACAADPPPASCFAIDGFVDAGVGQRTTWVLINESDAPASFSFYLYGQ